MMRKIKHNHKLADDQKSSDRPCMKVNERAMGFAPPERKAHTLRTAITLLFAGSTSVARR
ncbi:hypothetical protein F7734_08900 [Scytonema sp. UIC 10036]|uniref:hypothetical protein n=1 Tax=Scytonema sp. UIC 10036 TaxID=2304196 RepID=UPI0012DAB4AF|nr:hypothetical protein [Scytonema sp. UIC 10036]MUG92570.1 hypothetical protein [Scytonema sp. UIC 10036]